MDVVYMEYSDVAHRFYPTVLAYSLFANYFISRFTSFWLTYSKLSNDKWTVTLQQVILMESQAEKKDAAYKE